MRRWLVFAAAPIAVGLSLFHLYTAYFGVLVALLQRSIHLMVVMFLVYLLYPLSERHKDHPMIIAADLLCAATSVVCIGYIAFNYEYVINREGLASPVSPTEYWLGVLTFFFLLDAVRRAAGWPLAAVTLTAILYAMLGAYMPGML
ncbi:MAG: C4-dicarboxylate ABC transporter permease, partial [Nitrospinaceae bacterium]|nr:C4-dicarboxylate ABC transporter permease [Nitrospinaceae bacterium]